MMKELFFYLITLVTMFNTYFLYFNEGLTQGIATNKFAYWTIGLLMFIILFETISLISDSRMWKKFSYRIMLIIMFVLFGLSLYSRAIEPQVGLWWWRWIQTCLYGVIILSLVGLSNKLYLKLKEILVNLIN